jgi:hypothetical protein
MLGATITADDDDDKRSWDTLTPPGQLVQVVE